MNEEAKPSVPPGIRMELEARDARLRERGITEASLIAMLLEDAARERAILRTPALFTAMLEDAHPEAGWRARRKLRKDVLASLDAVRGHVLACPTCAAWMEVVVGMTAYVDPKRKTAPTE